MTQEEFNYMLQVAVAEGLPGGSFTMKYSWEEIEALLIGAYTKEETDTLLQKKVNQNLLDNPWFTVNQRGVSSYATNGSYGVDRWKCGYADTVSINDNNEITLNGTLGHSATLEQPMERSLLNLIGKQVTFSFLTTSGDVKSASFTVRDSVENYYSVDNENKEHVCIDTRGNIQTCYVEISGKSVTIKAIKLELGNVSTLASDIPPNYAQELTKCQRYFQVIPVYSAIGVNVWTTSCEVYYKMPTTMRTIPSATFPSDLTSIVRELGNVNLTPTSISLNDSGPYLSPEFVSIVIRGSGMKAGKVYSIGANIPLSADL